jgi:hypothetical protein
MLGVPFKICVSYTVGPVRIESSINPCEEPFNIKKSTLPTLKLIVGDKKA